MKLIETRRTQGYYGRWRVLWVERVNSHQFTIQLNPFKLTRSKGPHISIDLHGRGSRFGWEFHNHESTPSRYFSFWFTNPRVHAWYAFHVYVYLPDRKGKVLIPAFTYR